ncbi:MAG: hypothetical protein ACK5X3_23815 [Pseudomonadota bacterium]
MTKSFAHTQTKLVSVVPSGTTSTGIVAFRDYKGDVHHLDFEAYGETAKKLQDIKIGSKFDAEGNLDIYKERNYLTVFNISSISGVKNPDPEEVAQTTPEPTPVAAIAPKTTKSAAPQPPASNDFDEDSIPF